MVFYDMRKDRILALLDAVQKLHDVVCRERDMEASDAERAWSELEAITPEKPVIVRSFAELAETCKKRPFDSEERALRSNARNGHTMRAYCCPRCQKWHVTKRDFA